MADRDPYQQITSLTTYAAALVVVVLGGCLLWLSGLEWFDEHGALQTLVEQLGGLLIVAVALAIAPTSWGCRSVATSPR